MCVPLPRYTDANVELLQGAIEKQSEEKGVSRLVKLANVQSTLNLARTVLEGDSVRKEYSREETKRGRGRAKPGSDWLRERRPGRGTHLRFKRGLSYRYCSSNL